MKKNNINYILALFVIGVSLGILVLGRQSGMVTVADFNSGCKIAEQTFFTLKCEPDGNAQPILRNISGGNTDTFTVLTATGSYTNNIDFKTPGRSSTFTLKDTGGNILCRAMSDPGTVFEPFGVIYPDVTKTSCNNVKVETGQPYTVITRSYRGLFGSDDPGKISFEQWGRTLRLKYYDSRGIYGNTLPASDNCKQDDFTKDFNKLSGWDADSKIARSIAMQESNTLALPQAYRETAQVAPVSVNGQAGTCDQVNKIVYGYTKVNGLSGQCYALPDTSQILIDGRTQPYFACNTQACQSVYNLPKVWNLNSNFVCEEGKLDQQCQVASDCQFTPQFIDTINSAGVIQTTLRDMSCVQNQCVQDDKQVGCNPLRVYPNTLVCKKDQFGNYLLEQATVTGAPGAPLIPPIGKEEGGEKDTGFKFDTNMILLIVLAAVIIIFLALAASGKLSKTKR